MITQNKRLIGIFISVVFLLFIPWIAMQFTMEVKWTINDFVVAAVLLLSTGLLCELVIRKAKDVGKGILIVAGILTIFLLIWAELAVGIFGAAFAGS